MKLRQCVFVCKDLERSRDELCDILGIEVAYRDPGVAKWGLVNVVCPTGHDFLEIVTPFQQGTSAGRYIERRHGDGGYMVIIQVDDAQAERKRITDLGIRAVAQKDLPEYQYTHFHPADTSGVLLSLDTTVAQALPGVAAYATVLIVFADVPLISTDTLSACLTAAGTHNVAVVTAQKTEAERDQIAVEILATFCGQGVKRTQRRAVVGPEEGHVFFR
jgi:catechol 2,3-dioxygenase-like lactoylglutathione lyase family enzyme